MPKCHNSCYKSARYGCCNNTANNKIFIGKVSRLFANFPDGLESFQTVQTLFTLSGNFPHCQETVWKRSGPTGNFPDRLETFQTVWKLSRPAGNFAECPETFQTVWKLLRPCRKCSDCPETFQTVWKLSTLVYSSVQLMLRLPFKSNFVHPRKNFPDAQKLSGWQCQRAN